MRALGARAEPIRVALAQDPGADAGLLERIRGQASDLAVTIGAVDATPPSGDVPEQLRWAGAVCAAQSARAVLWVNRAAAPKVFLYASRPSTGSVVTRAIDCPPEDTVAQSSACLETVALAARTALQTLMIGTAADVPVVPKPADPVPDRWHWSVAAGWAASVDGQTELGQHGLTARLGVTRERWEGTLALLVGLPAAIEDDLTVVELQRHTSTASVLFHLYDGHRIGLLAGARGGAALFNRATTAVKSEDIVATASRATVSPLVGAELGCRIALGAGGLALGLGAGLDFVPGAPQLVYRDLMTPRSQRRIWPMQPWVGLTILTGGSRGR